MNIELLPCADLIPYARNAKTHSPEQVAAIAGSIKEFGFNGVVLVDKENGIIAGHGRVLAAQKLGMKEVPCVRLLHLTDAQKRAFILADNRLAEYGTEWDLESLKVELEAIKTELPDMKMDMIGFDNADMEALFRDMSNIEPGAVVTEESDASVSIKNDIAVCPLSYRFDVVTGRCSFGCEYCYTLKTPAANTCKGAQIKKEKEIIKALDTIPANSICLTGIMIEPTLAGPRLGFTAKEAQKRNLGFGVQTKNPAGLCDILEAEGGIDFANISVKVAFSIVGNKAVEPHAPDCDSRYEGARRLAEHGASIVFRQQPWILGLDGDRFLEFLAKFRDFGCERYICEPLRWSKCWTPYRARFEEAVGDGFTVDKYYEDFGNGKDYGALHWRDLDPVKVRELFIERKALVASYGMKFGICSGPFGQPNCDLNDGEICCGCKATEGRDYDRLAIHAIVARGELGRYHFPEAPKDADGRRLFLDRIDAMNNPLSPFQFDVAKTDARNHIGTVIPKSTTKGGKNT